MDNAVANLKVNICGLELSNPILPAAGPPSKDGATLEAAAKGGAGGLVTKTISVEPAQVPHPNMAEIRGGFLNAELWSELPKEQWIETEYKMARATGLPVIVGLGYTAEQIRELAPLVRPFADALELSTHYVGNTIAPIIDALCAAKEAVDVPVFMKLSPHPNIQEIALALEDAGADASGDDQLFRAVPGHRSRNRAAVDGQQRRVWLALGRGHQAAGSALRV